MLAHVPILDSRGRDAAVIDRPSQPLLDFSQKHQRIRYTSLRIAWDVGSANYLELGMRSMGRACIPSVHRPKPPCLIDLSIRGPRNEPKRTQSKPIVLQRLNTGNSGTFPCLSCWWKTCQPYALFPSARRQGGWLPSFTNPFLCWLNTRTSRDSQRAHTCRPTYSGGSFDVLLLSHR